MKVVNVAILAVLLCFAVVLSGCCTIMSGSTQRVKVSSEPSGAKVAADDGTTIVTPGAFTLVRKETHTLVAELPGYEPQTQQFVKKLNNWIFANILIDFGIISVPIDFLTGSADELHPKEVHFNFKGASKTGASAIPFPYKEMLVERENELKHLKICRNPA